MRHIYIINFGDKKPRYLPMHEMFLSQELKKYNDVQIKIVTIFNKDNPEKWVRYFKNTPEGSCFLFWETKSAKSYRYINNYFRYAKILKKELDISLISGGYWPTSSAEAFKKEFEYFDTLIKGYSFEKIADFLVNVDMVSLPEAVDCKGLCDWNRYPLSLDCLEDKRAYGDRGFVAGYQTTFACPNDCYFCYNNHLNQIGCEYSERDLSRLREDIILFKKEYNLDHLQLKDMNFFYNKERAFSFMDYLHEENICLAENVDITVKDMEEEIFKKFREYNFKSLFFGLESFSEKSLQLLNKEYSQEKLIRGFEFADKYKTFMTGSILIGFPWQTVEEIRGEIKKAIYYMNKYKYVQIGFNSVRPIIGTTVQKKYFSDLQNKVSFQDYLDIIGFKVFPIQRLIYGSQFDYINMEKLHVAMLAIKHLRKLEVQYPNFLFRNLFPRIRRRIEKHALAFSEGNRLINALLYEPFVKVVKRYLDLFGRFLHRCTRKKIMEIG